ncbi:Eco57I restriction-modification methylase domain-containing protein [Bacillus cereus]
MSFNIINQDKGKSRLCNLTNEVELLSVEKNNITTQKEKKERGQFFTSTAVAKLMVQMISFKKKNLQVLDPGSGTGILIAALVERVINENLKVNISVDLYENDSKTIPFLYKSMELCLVKMRENGNGFKYNIIEEDYIISHESYFEHSLFEEKFVSEKYDIVISNPPYYKLNKQHKYSKILKEYIFGQPNVYFMFMAVSERLLKQHGQLIFLTPRSYCSGPYFQKFRKLFFAKIQPSQFHLFESRKSNFPLEKILQENVILNGFKIKKPFDEIIISTSNTSDIHDSYKEFRLEKKLVMSNNDNLIRLPVSEEEKKTVELFDSWVNSLEVMNMSISTGPVVTFRVQEAIKEFKAERTFPLLYMKHLNDKEIVFPLSHQEEGIEKNYTTKPILVPTKNYVIIKRFSSKEQYKRIYASALLKEKFPYEMVGLENHLNYIYKKSGELSEVETVGLVAFLNSKLVNKFFCIVNGHTQVNATDLKMMKFPNYDFLNELGYRILNGNLLDDQVDEFIKGYF